MAKVFDLFLGPLAFLSSCIAYAGFPTRLVGFVNDVPSSFWIHKEMIKVAYNGIIHVWTENSVHDSLESGSGVYQTETVY